MAGLGLVLLAGCQERKAQSETLVNTEAAAVPVTVAAATREDVPVEVKAIGWVEAFATVDIRSRVEGQVIKVHFTEGQDLKSGDPLFSIDPRPYQAAVHLAEANLARDQALARDAERDAQWIEGLFKQGTAAPRERDQTVAKADAAKATVRADEAALEQAQLNLEYTSIKAPIAGRAGELLVDLGNIVKPNDTTLVTIHQINPVYVAFSMPEQHIPMVKRHMQHGDLRVTALIPGDEGEAETGMLSFLDSRVDNTTGMIRLKGTFENRGRRLWPGQYVNVGLQLTVEENRVVVPSRAVQVGQKGQFVFVVGADRKAEIRPVRPGAVVQERTVILEGLEAGETVVTDGQLRLTGGTLVEFKADGAAAERTPATQGARR